MINAEIKIIKSNFYGFNNPVFVIEGLVYCTDYSFKVYVDGEEKKFKSRKCIDIRHFDLEIPLEKKDKKIEVKICSKDGVETIYLGENNLFDRFKSKLASYKIIRYTVKTCKMIGKLTIAFCKAIRILWREHHFLVPFSMWKKYYFDLIKKLKTIKSGEKTLNPLSQDDYLKWLSTNPERFEKVELLYNPLISVIIPVYNIERKLLSECIDSVLSQSYQNFEICLADDCSTNKETIDTLKEYEIKDKRIKVIYRKKNGHISEATNSALSLARGEFIALMDNDDLLVKDALYENVKLLNEDRTIDMIYSDEDKIDCFGRRDPNFKPDYSPDTLLSNNYICHFTVLRKSIVDRIGGFKVGMEGAQDYDLFLRFSEETSNIKHIPKLLYRWRMIPGSTATTIDSKNYAIEKGRKAIEDYLARKNIQAEVNIHSRVPYYLVDYLYDEEPLVTIIIPTKDHAETLDTCLKSVYKKTIYKNFEIIVVNNNSSEAETFELFRIYSAKYNNFRVIDANIEFNYSKINNMAVAESKGEYLVLLNNDIEVISENWLSVMVGYAMQEHVGAVGAKLLYPDNKVQHCGVIAGLGVATHNGLEKAREDVGIYARLAVPFNYSAVTAACLVIKKSKYLEVEGLNEFLKVNYNDIDFNFKLLKKGYYNVCVPQVELYHYESKSRGLATTDAAFKGFLKEQKYMYDTWSELIKNDPFYNINLSREKGFMLDEN